MSFLLKFLTSGILEKLLGYYETKDANKTIIVTKEIEAEIERRKLQKEIVAIESGWWVTRWCRPAIFYPFALHIGSIVLDTIFQFGWNVPALPGMFNDLEFAIVLSYFLTRPVEKGVRSYLLK